MTANAVSDDELLWRRIPRTEPWFKPPDQVTSLNFKLRSQETGLSIYRSSLTTSDDVLGEAKEIAEYFLVAARASDVRALRHPSGTPFGLNVIPDDPDGTNRGHALIVCPDGGKLTGSMSKRLCELFRPQ